MCLGGGGEAQSRVDLSDVTCGGLPIFMLNGNTTSLKAFPPGPGTLASQTPSGLAALSELLPPELLGPRGQEVPDTEPQHWQPSLPPSLEAFVMGCSLLLENPFWGFALSSLPSCLSCLPWPRAVEVTKTTSG